MSYDLLEAVLPKPAALQSPQAEHPLHPWPAALAVVKVSADLVHQPVALEQAVSALYRRVAAGQKLLVLVFAFGQDGGTRKSLEQTAMAAFLTQGDLVGLSVRGLKVDQPSDVTDDVLAGALAMADVVIAEGATGAWPMGHPDLDVVSLSARTEVLEKPLRVAVAGCGVVGGGVVRRLLAEPGRYSLVGVQVRDLTKERDLAIDPALWVGNREALLALQPDVVVDALADGDEGYALTREALWRGVAVVSANKQALSRDLERLQALAATAGTRLAYRAAVGGGTPMLEYLDRWCRLEGRTVVRLEGIINGTTNFVLSQMQSGQSFDTAVNAARRAGLAEADPSDDLNGVDAAAKLRLLAWQAFGKAGAAIRAEPVQFDPAAVAAKPGTRQVAVCERDGTKLRAFIRIEPVADPVFLRCADEQNALRVVFDDGQVHHVLGRGAGRRPTTESVMADLYDLSCAGSAPVQGRL